MFKIWLAVACTLDGALVTRDHGVALKLCMCVCGLCMWSVFVCVVGVCVCVRARARVCVCVCVHAASQSAGTQHHKVLVRTFSLGLDQCATISMPVFVPMPVVGALAHLGMPVGFHACVRCV